MNATDLVHRWWTDLLKYWRQTSPFSHRTTPFLEDDEKYPLSKILTRLSRGLTRDRGLAGESYMEGDELGAYLLYFWPVSYLQFQWVKDLVPFRQKRRVLDLASGPGPLGLGCLEAGAEEVWCLDPSEKALATAQGLAGLRGWTLRTQVWTAGQPLPPGPWDVVTLGHGLNEIALGENWVQARADLIEAVVNSLSPQGRFYWIDPATPQSNREALAVWEELASRGLIPLAPCLNRSSCPAFSDPEGVCHASFSWDPPSGFTSLAWAARLGKEDLKMTWFVYGPRTEKPQVPPGRVFRVVGDKLLSKSGRQRVFVCGPEGRLSLSAPEGKKEPWRGAFQDLRRGDVVRITDPEVRETGLGLGPESRLEIVRRSLRIQNRKVEGKKSPNRA